MDEQAREDLQALRRALARLASELHEATHALRSLSACLSDSVQPYYECGAPFGPSERGLRIWLQYGQFTTSS